MKFLRGSLLVFLCTMALKPAFGKDPQPLGVPGKWKLVDQFSDEFSEKRINTKKWNKNMSPWGERAWDPKNLSIRDGSLYIRAVYEPHTDRKGNKYWYKLGIIQSKKKTTYGYFEARIKGCSKFPGLCPAFWLYSNGKEKSPKHPHITYSEIDIIELQQGGWNPETKKRSTISQMDCNLHCRIMIDGKETWQRPNSLPDVCRHHWEAPWDPRDDYHVYACENTPEKITWYIDGKKVAEEKNLYWHLPMNVTLTMELRPPLIGWAGVDGREAKGENSTPEGFPTEMAIDYVRTWVWDDSVKYQKAEKPKKAPKKKLTIKDLIKRRRQRGY